MTNLNSVYKQYTADTSQLNNLLQAVIDYVTTVCRRSGHSNAEDLAQDVVTKVWLSLAKFEGKSAFSTWVYTITKRHLFEVAKRQADPWLLGEDLDIAPAPCVDDRLIGDFATLTLSDRDRLVLNILLKTGDFTLTAKVLNITTSAVRAKIERIKKKKVAKKKVVFPTK